MQTQKKGLCQVFSITAIKKGPQGKFQHLTGKLSLRIFKIKDVLVKTASAVNGVRIFFS